MNFDKQAHKALIITHETLRARMEIRDFFLNSTVREVYENIGQVLSLVRMQLTLIEGNTNLDTGISIQSSGKLVGQSIQGLRAMCKSFYPDIDILKQEGFVEIFENILKILFENTKAVIKEKGIRKELQPALKLIVVNLLRSILISVKEVEGELSKLAVHYNTEKIEFIITYLGKEIEKQPESTSEQEDKELSFTERLALIKAKISITRATKGLTQIKLISPLKLAENE